MDNPNTSIVPEKLDRLAIWVGLSVASAFFSSLERFACVNLNTYDTDDDEEDEEVKEANDRPLMISNVPSDAPAFPDNLPPV